MSKKMCVRVKKRREYDTERETRVLLEEIGSNVRLLAESHTGIAGRLDRLEGKVNNIESELGTVKLAVMENTGDIRELKTGQDEMKLDIQKLKFGQDTIKQKLDTVTVNHEQRILRLETKIN